MARMFARRHYKVLASCVNDVVKYQLPGLFESNVEDEAARKTAELIANRIAFSMGSDSWKFDPAKFMQACGLEDKK